MYVYVCIYIYIYIYICITEVAGRLEYGNPTGNSQK